MSVSKGPKQEAFHGGDCTDSLVLFRKLLSMEVFLKKFLIFFLMLNSSMNYYLPA